MDRPLDGWTFCKHKQRRPVPIMYNVILASRHDHASMIVREKMEWLDACYFDCLVYNRPKKSHINDAMPTSF